MKARSVGGRAATPLQMPCCVAAGAPDFGLQLRLGRLWRMQELEADALGLVLARNAGWPAQDLLSFVDRLVADERDEAAPLAATHPSASTRRQYACVVSELYDAALIGR